MTSRPFRLLLYQTSLVPFFLISPPPPLPPCHLCSSFHFRSIYAVPMLHASKKLYRIKVKIDFCLALPSRFLAFFLLLNVNIFYSVQSSLMNHLLLFGSTFGCCHSRHAIMCYGLLCNCPDSSSDTFCGFNHGCQAIALVKAFNCPRLIPKKCRPTPAPLHKFSLNILIFPACKVESCMA